MERPRDTRKPAAFPLTGSEKIDTLGGKIDVLHNTNRNCELQVDRILRRWKLSPPLARCTAELAFGRGASA